MSQSGYTPILIYASGTATNVPLAANLTSSASGAELALNYADGKLYYKNSSGTVTLLASAAGSLGDVVGPASATDNALARFDLTTGKLIQNSVGILSDTGALSGITDIAASGSITLSGGTANGVAYLNGSKVLTTGSALVFDGTNLGLGVTPNANWATLVGLQVSTTAVLSGQPSAEVMRLGSNWYFGGGFKYLSAATATRYDQNDGKHSWYNAPAGASAGDAITFTQAMTLDASGNLGIGTTSPSSLLHVRGDGNAIQQLRIANSQTSYNTDLALFTHASGDFSIGLTNSAVPLTNQTMTFLVNNSSSGQITAMKLDSSGNLGVGTSSPLSRLDVAVEATLTRRFLVNFDDSVITVKGASNTAAPEALRFIGDGIRFNTGTSGSGTERARIDSSGNLLVGRTTTANTTVGSGLYADGYVASCQSASTNANTAYDLYSTGAAAYRFYVGMGGTIYATSIVITAISDERLKENVRDIDTGLDSIMALKPRRFDWKEGKGQDKKDVAGFIAQEFENVFPECVSTSKAGEDGIEYKNINHETLIPTLVKAIQEQQALITALTARITALEGA